MPKLSVPEAARRLGVSPMRIRQRIDEGSLVAERVGGRWLVDLSVVPEHKTRGRPVKPELIWDAIRCVDAAESIRHDSDRPLAEVLPVVFAEVWKSPRSSRYAPDLVLPDGSLVEIKASASSRRRALQRLLSTAEGAAAADPGPSFQALLRWLGGRAHRRLYRVAGPDFGDLREDNRIVLSGLSHPRSGMQDPRVVEGYVAADALAGIVGDYWLDPPGVDANPNVYLHIAPGRPEEISPLMLAADLFEHDGPRERERAIELVREVFG